MNRNKSLDIISGIMIIWMIILHAFQWANLRESIIYSSLLKCLFFFMSWFYFKTGYLSTKPRSLKASFRKGIDQLIITMIIWTMVGYLITVPELLNENYPIWKIPIAPIVFILKNGDTIGNSPLWFLLSLFFVKILLPYINHLNFNRKIALAILIVCIGYVFQKFNIKLPLGLDNLPLGMFFTLSGLLCKDFNILDKTIKIHLLLILPYVLLSVYFASYIDFHNNTLVYGSYGFFILNTLFAINLSLIIFKDFNFNFLSWIGEKSMIYLLIHWPIFYLIKITFNLLNMATETYLFVFVLILISLSFSTCIAYFIPYRYLGLQSSIVTNFKTRIILENK